MTHPLTNALAMRTAAANTARAYRDQWRCANGFEGFATGAKIINEAILALPLEADHAALLAEAMKIPEIATLITIADHGRAVQAAVAKAVEAEREAAKLLVWTLVHDLKSSMLVDEDNERRVLDMVAATAAAIRSRGVAP